MRSISWLHFTDLHLGSGSDSWLWPGVKDIVFQDLKQLHDRCGPWDLVLATGDEELTLSVGDVVSVRPV